MHETKHPLIRGFLDHNNIGWCFHTVEGTTDVRFKDINGTITVLQRTPRQDVVDFYKNQEILNCGWSLSNAQAKEGTIEMYIDGTWVEVFVSKDRSDTNYVIPSYIVIDNFYKHPEEVRAFALRQNFVENIKYYKGARTAAFRFEGLKERFEQILNRKIKNWTEYGANGCFQFCKKDDLTVYHCDQQEYAGVLFLTPDAPVNAGTQIFRSIHTKKTTVSDEDINIVFKNGNYDGSAFESVDNVGNVYNRLLLFNSRQIHAAPVYFGDCLENARLFQLFFFDLE